MSGARQLLRGGQAGRSRADDGDTLAGLRRRDLGLHPAVLPGLVDDRAFDRLDGDRRVLEVQRARGLARRRADAAGELREIVGRMQVARRLFPIAAIDEVVPVRDLVVHRAAGMAVGNAAIHAARRLVARAFLAERNEEFAVVANAIRRRQILAVAAVDLEETRYLTHIFVFPSSAASRLAHSDTLNPQSCLCRRQADLFRRHLGLRLLDLLQRAAVLDRHHLHEARQILRPVVEDLLGPRRAGVACRWLETSWNSRSASKPDMLAMTSMRPLNSRSPP